MHTFRDLITTALAITIILTPLGCSTGPGGLDGNNTPDVGPSVDVTDISQPPDTGPNSDVQQAPPCSATEDCAGVATGSCQVAVCDPETNTCVIGPDKNFSPCDDGDACTIDEVCQDGACTRGIQRICDDGNPCTTDQCDAVDGCQFEANDATCDDGNGCTADDQCAAGECTGTPSNDCDCVVDDDCAGSDDDDLCNGSLVCANGTCEIDEDTIVVCPESEGGVCAPYTCVPDTGACELSLLSDLPCSDGNACTEGDTCVDGLCVGANAACECQADADCAVFDDADLCNGVLVCSEGTCVTDPESVVICGANATLEDCSHFVCEPATGECGLESDADGIACSDGATCTEGDQCLDGTCTGTSVVCDDGNTCTDDTCDESAQGCVFANNTAPCEAGDACTEQAQCTDGECVPGGPVSCDDDDLCTDDACDPEVGCVYAMMDCDDDDICTVDSCALGFCVNTFDINNPECAFCVDDLECADDDPCTDNWCDASSGQCFSAPTDCDDTNPCTVDTCLDDGSCDWAPIDGGACDDDEDCTMEDACVAGECLGLPDPDCGLCGDSVCDPEESCSSCALDCGACDGACCQDNGSAGCEDEAVTECVCALDDFCCTGTWDDACAETATEQCDLTCLPPCGDDQCSAEESCLTCPADCGPCDSDACCAPHDSPGCQDDEITACACEADEYCCLFDWDEYCVEEAVLSCGLTCNACGDGECALGEGCSTCPSDCGACAGCGDGTCDDDENCGTCAEDCGTCLEGDCCEANDSPGCENSDITACTCDVDATCCDGAWDELCVIFATEYCELEDECTFSCGDGVCDPGEFCDTCAEDCGECASCGNGLCEGDEQCTSCPEDCGSCEGSCCDTHDGPGCEDQAVALCVCDTADAWCCEVEWDELCVEAAKANCGACTITPPTGACCEPHDGFGCEDPAIAACVCADEPFCCAGKWDEFCVEAAQACGAECGTTCGDGACGSDENCDNCAVDCGTCEGPCCEAHDGLGCSDEDTTTCVCDIDPSCCENAWTDTCAIQAVIQCGWTDDCSDSCGDTVCALGESCASCPDDCGACGTCGDGACGPAENCANCSDDCGTCEGGCCEANDSPGCEDPDVTDCVCEADAWCCELIWDELCIKSAALKCDACDLVPEPECGDDTCNGAETCSTCPADCSACEGSCCEPHGAAGCGDDAVEACVCEAAPFCCEGEWDIICAALAVQDCGAICEVPPVCGDGECNGDETCGTCYGDCGACDGDCCEENATPGCFDPLVTSCVCLEDDFCCLFEWDDSCTWHAENTCGMDCDAAYCGNGECDDAEDCASCPDDCGTCAENACCETSPDGAGGCADPAIEACVCDLLPDCCDDAWGWDIQCAGLADTMCDAGCEAPPVDCCEEHDGLGCGDAATETCVCDADPDCCDLAWDTLCVEQAAECGGCSATGPCCEAHGGVGCDDSELEACVCAADPVCCDFTWDETCVELAQSDACGGCNDPSANNCCVAADDSSAGCDEPDVAACVCALADYCCTDAWDGLCAGIAVEACGATCGETDACGDSVCEAPLGASHLVTITGEGFEPADLVVEAGDSVTWVNGDTAPHSATSSSGPVPFNLPLMEGQQGSMILPVPGSYTYYDVFDATLTWTGTIEVAPASNGETCASCPVDCGPCPGAGSGDCCETTAEAGCADPAIQQCVCDSADENAAFCCDTAWDGYCVDLVTILDCGSCIIK